MFSAPINLMPGLGTPGGPMSGLVPVELSFALAVVAGFVILASGALWLLGEILKHSQYHYDGPPAHYRAAA